MASKRCLATVICFAPTTFSTNGFAQMTRNPDWQASMAAKPLKARLRMAEEARRQSLEQTLNLSMEIMDVNQDEVKRVIQKHNVGVLLHGHTHRPGIHKVEVGHRKATRIVLGDWYTQGSVLRWDSRGPKLGGDAEVSRG